MNKYYSNLIISRENIQLKINKTLKNTYLLLSSTMFFSVFISILSIKHNVEHINLFVFITFYLSLLYLINNFKNTQWGIFFVFILTGLLGYSAGPMLTDILNIKNGKEIILYSLFLSGFTFLMCSLYVVITKKNFDFLSGFLYIGLIIILICMLASYFIKLTIINLLISGIIIIFSSLMMLYEISKIVNGGEDNYVLVTVSLYLQIYNIFISLLNIIGLTSERE